MNARTLIVLGATLAGAFALVVAAHADPIPRLEHQRDIGYGQIRFDGAGPERWHARYAATRAKLAAARLELRHQRRVLLARPHVGEAIQLAATIYGHGTTLWRKARCETGGTFSPTAHNPSGASGLFQFLGSTWSSTPFAGFSIWSPYANALAAGWMHQHGRGNEWTCR